MSDRSAWDFVPLSKYAAPGFSTEAIRSLHGTWKALRKKVASWYADGDSTPSDLELPSELPEKMIPEPDIDAAARSLRDWLSRRIEQKSKRCRLLPVIGPLGTYVPQIVSAAAEASDWIALETPSRRNLATDPDAMRESLELLREPTETPIVIERLESWFLRNETALPQFRVLVQAMANGSRPLLVGCNSWTWAYLDRVLGIAAALGEPLVLAPFDGAGLDDWLGASFRSGGLVCMRAGSRDEIFPPQLAEDSGPASMLEQLASAARGNPGVARAIWQRSLRESDARAGDEDKTATEQGRSWWAVAPEEAELDLPAEADDIDRFALHSSLLHGGLDVEFLSRSLPFADHEVRRRTNRLSAAGILIESECGLIVSEAAYIPVRNSLATRGFLVDAL